MNDRTLNPAYYETLAAARGIKPAPARSWSILLTSANHGAVGPLGSTFPHAGEHHERVKVVEIVEAGAPPAPGTDLTGLVRLPLTNEQIDDAWDSIPATFTRGQGEQEWNRENRRAFARAIEREVAAQAGQVAVPEWGGIKAVLTNLIAVAGVRIADKDEEDDQLIADSQEAVRQLNARLAAAPSAPAVAQQVPAQAEPGEADKAAALLVTLYEGEEIQNAARILIEQAMEIEELRAQASTAGERQEGGGRG